MAITMKRALAIAAKKWGKQAMVEDKGRQCGPSSPELRQAAAAESERLRAEKPLIKEFKDYPDDMTLGEYRAEKARVSAATAEWKKQHDPLIWKAGYHRYQVGKATMGLFFEVRGSGDSWEDALAKAGFTDAEIHPNLVGVEA